MCLAVERLAVLVLYPEFHCVILWPKAIQEKIRSIKGIGNKENLKDWADYAKSNSYIRDKAEARHNIGTEGCEKDLAEGLPPLPRQRDSEGKGYAPIDKVTARNTYTTNDSGTKRG